jgi:hypothetical protein
MSAVSCPVGERLSAFLDGDLSGSEAQVVRAHVEGCAACARLLGELGALVSASRGLDRPEPPPTMWAMIEGALDSRPRRSAWTALVESWRVFAAGTLAGAAVVGAVALTLALGGRGHHQEPLAVAPQLPATSAPLDPMVEEAEAEFAQAAAAYERSIGKLRALLERESARWSPDQRTRYAERLARLDDSIARSREAARRTPGDSAGNEQLFAAYQQKIAFLTEAVHRGGAFGESSP